MAWIQDTVTFYLKGVKKLWSTPPEVWRHSILPLEEGDEARLCWGAKAHKTAGSAQNLGAPEHVMVQKKNWSENIKETVRT